MVSLIRGLSLTRSISPQAMEEIVHAAHALDRRPEVKAIIITGDGPKYFAAGADIKEMADQTYEEVKMLLICCLKILLTPSRCVSAAPGSGI